MLTDSELTDIFLFYNPWWLGKMPSSLLKPYHRPVFTKCLKYLHLERILVIKGPRRVGKTTLVYQLIDELLKRKPPQNIFYLSFDDPRLNDLDSEHIIGFYENKILKKPLEKENVYFFFDEVQYFKKWPFLIKRYFDRHYPIKFIVSGSSSTLMKKGAESLAGRTIEEILLPFSFKECVECTTNERIDLGDFDSLESLDLLKIKRYEKQLKLLFEKYIRQGGFPNLFEINDETLWPKIMREDIVEKVIYKDLVNLYDIKKPEILEKLFFYAAGINGQILNVQNISRTLGLSREYINHYLLYLKNAYLLFTIEKFALSLEKTLRSQEKVYIFDPGLTNALLNKREITRDYLGHLIEGMVAVHLFGKEVYYWKNYFEIDFIIKDKRGILPLEVKYQRKIDHSDLKGLFSFADKFKVEKMMVVSEDLYQRENIDGRTVLFIPAWLFLCAAA